MLQRHQEWESRTTQFRRLLVSLDGSESAESVLPYVRAMAKTFDSKVVLLAVPESETEIGELEKYLTSITKALTDRGFKVAFEVKGSGSSRTLLEVSREEGFNLIRKATRGRGSSAPHDEIGSVAEQLMESTICHMFLVPIRTSRGIR